MNEQNINDTAIKMAQTLNLKLHAEQLFIPLINNFKIEQVQDPQMILSATDGMFIEQLVSDGPMNPNETFEQRINLVEKNTLNFMKSHSSLNNEQNLFFYKDYSNGIFNYKIYVQDFIVNVQNTTKVIRQLNAYFIEPKFNDFYQLTIASPALQMPTEILKLGVVDIASDQITQSLDNLLKLLMDNLKYKDDNQNNIKSDLEQFKSNDEINLGTKSTSEIKEENDSMDIDEEVETTINNESDYSNIIASVDNIAYIVQYCDNVYTQFQQLVAEDEQKNERLKYEFKNYNYKKSYGDTFEVKIRVKDHFTPISCTNYNSFNDAVSQGQLKNLDSLEIELNLDYKRGNNDSLKDHQNLFKISFKPYDIKLIRKSNHNEQNMNQIEENIKQLLNRFSVANTIFCTK